MISIIVKLHCECSQIALRCTASNGHPIGQREIDVERERRVVEETKEDVEDELF